MLRISYDAPLGPHGWTTPYQRCRVDYRGYCTRGDFLLIYQVESHLQAPQNKSVEIFMADTLASHRYPGHRARILEGAKASVPSRRMDINQAKI